MKAKTIWIGFILLMVLNLTGCGREPQEFDGENAWVHLKELTAEDKSGRFPGTKGHDQAAEYIADKFQEMGLQPDGGTGSYFQEFSCVTPVLASPPKFEIMDASGVELESLEHRVDYAEATKGFATGGVAEGTMEIYRGIESLQEETSILLLTDSSQYSEENCKAFAEWGVKAVIRSTQKKLRGENYDRLIKSVYLGERKESFVEQGLISLVVTEATMQKLLEYAEQDLIARIDVDLQFPKVAAKNVIGMVEGVDPELKDEVILITAHYDHVGVDPDGSVYPGVLDNASGVSAMMELARIFSVSKPGRTMVFVAFDAEEIGLKGSHYFAYHASKKILPLEHAQVINLDMIGSTEPVVLSVVTEYGKEEKILGETDISDLIQEIHCVAEKQNLLLEFNRQSAGSDHMSFLSRGVPAVSFVHMSTNKIHTPEDTIGNCSVERMEEVGDLLVSLLDRVANQRRGALTVSLGVVTVPKIIGISVWLLGLAFLIWRRVIRRKKRKHRHSLLAIFLVMTVISLIILGTRSDFERDLPASLAPTPWNRMVAVDLPGIQGLIDFKSAGDLVCVASTAGGDRVIRLNETGKRSGQKDWQEYDVFAEDVDWVDDGDSEDSGVLGQMDDQGRVHMIFPEVNESGQEELFYRWINRTGTISQPVFLGQVDRNEDWTFVMDQAMGMVLFCKQDKTSLLKFPLGTDRATSITHMPLVIHDISGAFIHVQEFQFLNSNGSLISVVATGMLDTGESLIEQLELRQGKVAGHRTIYRTKMGMIEDLSFVSMNGYDYLAWMDQEAERVNVISSNPIFGVSPFQTSLILAVSFLIQSLIQGMIVFITRIYWILPGGICLLIFVIRREEEISLKGVCFAIGLNILFQALTFGMPNLLGRAAENWIVTIGVAMVVAVIVWLYGLERGRCSPIRRFMIFTVLNVFFISMLYGTIIFETGLDRLNQTEFFGSQSEMLNK